MQVSIVEDFIISIKYRKIIMEGIAMGNNTALTVQETFRQLSKRYNSINVKQLNELLQTKDSIVSTGISYER